MASDWLAIAAAAVGGGIALAGGFVTDSRGDRRERGRDRARDRWETYVEFARALNAAHAGFRAAAEPPTPGADRASAALLAVHDSGLYAARERLLMSGTAEIAEAGERAFLDIIAMRNLIREGCDRSSPAYHEAYHVLAEALWNFRGAVRRELGERLLEPGSMGKVTWSEREGCAVCSRPDPPI